MGEKPTEADEAAEEQKTWLASNFRRETEEAQEVRPAGIAVSDPGVPGDIAVSDPGVPAGRKIPEIRVH